MLLGEVGKLREERRNLQLWVTSLPNWGLITERINFSEIGTLLCLRSKYDPGGMFDPDWSVYPFVSIAFLTRSLNSY